ncbi:MAG: hypothetical protein IKX23_10565 [Treponema sp.]|nr:hypothetical protein [Treponema sp.]
MKKALKLIVFYFATLFVLLICGTLFYSLYLSVLNYIDGKEIVLFSKQIMSKSFFYMSIVSIFLICPFLAYSRIRHKGGFLQLISYMLLCAVTWLFLFPVTVKYGSRLNAFSPVLTETKTLSGGLFRKAENRIFYFTDDFDSAVEKKLPGVFIDTEDEGGLKVKQIQKGDDELLVNAAKPYNDIIIKKAFYEDGGISYISFRPLIQKAQSSLQKGKTFWMGFLSLALLICSIYGISSFFKWRLLNAWAVCFSVIAAIGVNTLYTLPKLLEFRTKLEGFKLFVQLQNYFDDAPIVCLNLLFSLIFIVTGIIKFFVSYKRDE